MSIRLDLTLLLLGTVFTAYAQGPAFDEYQAKAALLYNFAKFVEWPPGTFAKPATRLPSALPARIPSVQCSTIWFKAKTPTRTPPAWTTKKWLAPQVRHGFA